MDRTVNSPHHFPGGGGNPTSIGVDGFGHVVGEHETIITDTGIVAPGSNL